MSKDNNLKDPLSEINELPKYATELGINHWSPSQGNKRDGAWLYEYVVLTQEQRRSLPGNSAMKGGVCVGEILQKHYADTIWRINPNTKKLSPMENPHKGKNKDELITMELEQFKNYDPVDDKDQEKKERYMDQISTYAKYGFLAIAEIGAVISPVTCEEQLTTSRLSHQDLLLPDLPIVQRTDMVLGDNGPLPKAIYEFKTQWDRLGKVKKDGGRSFVVIKPPAAPKIDHVMQCASYSAYYNFKVPVYLIYICSQGYKIFSADNCEELKTENLKKFFNNLVNVFIRRERMFEMYQDKNKDELITNVASMMDPYFDHPYAWNNFTPEMLQQAKKIFNFNDL